MPFGAAASMPLSLALGLATNPLSVPDTRMRLEPLATYPARPFANHARDRSMSVGDLQTADASPTEVGQFCRVATRERLGEASLVGQFWRAEVGQFC